MASSSACDFVAQRPHPRTYASFVPWCAQWTSHVPRLDLVKPKYEWSIGRGPHNDFMLQPRQISWNHCVLVWDREDVKESHIRLFDLGSVNGTWVNNTRVKAGTGADDGRLLKNGDIVAFGLTMPSSNEPLNDGTFEYEEGQDLRYTFHQFTEGGPPEMTKEEEDIRNTLDLLDREHTNINVQRRILNAYLEPAPPRERSLFSAGAGVKDEPYDVKLEPLDGLLPPTPITMHPVKAESSDYPGSITEEERGWIKVALEHADATEAEIVDLREQLTKEAGDFLAPTRYDPFEGLDWITDTDVNPDKTEDEEIHAALATVQYDIPPALPDGATSTTDITSEGHDPHGADWNDPQIVWIGDLHLNRSKPLRVPLAWIYWSNAHHLPVYVHPNYKPVKETLHAATARPHARLAKLFSDASAAAAQRELAVAEAAATAESAKATEGSDEPDDADAETEEEGARAEEGEGEGDDSSDGGAVSDDEHA
ncbi:hypothetical protein PENSPDRAFT_690129 [Peniophora sp. CONT]|nr:hypothetical protein PENSPDRAFT_690129 [Peniophora sp. CONT]